MSLFNSIAKSSLEKFRKPAIDRLKNIDESMREQEKTLSSLLQSARKTKFGVDHGFSEIRGAADYQKRVKLRTYEDFFNDYFLPSSIEAAKKVKSDYDPKLNSPHLDNIIWPGLIRYFSLSSGTTSGTTKFIPMTRELLRSNRKASVDAALFHYIQKADSKILAGRTLLLGGNPILREDWKGSVKSGDLSGVIIHHLPFLFCTSYFPGMALASIPQWEEKIDRIAEAALSQNLSILSGVPTWMILFLEKLNEKKKIKGNIKSLWPNFELFVHGGIPFEPYQKQFEEWLGPDADYLEVYPASEAFIAIEDPRENELRLMTDYGTFYEFVPVEEISSKAPTRLTVRDVEVGKNYAIVLTTNGGLWSYILGDTVRFVSKEPLLLKITGRTKYCLSAFGEHLIQEEIEKALHETCLAFGTGYTDYHAAPIFPDSVHPKGKHQYLIEFTKQPQNLKEFSGKFDAELQRLNEDYAQHRSGGFGMDEPEIIAVQSGFFKEWMRKKGKLGGQYKVPRISASREVISDMLSSFSVLEK